MTSIGGIENLARLKLEERFFVSNPKSEPGPVIIIHI